jgi:hypothetical protein
MVQGAAAQGVAILEVAIPVVATLEVVIPVAAILEAAILEVAIPAEVRRAPSSTPAR